MKITKFSKLFPIIKPEVQPLGGSYLKDLEEIYSSKMLTNNKWVESFEFLLAQKHNTGCTALSSCTSGLILSLNYFKVSGKEVITPAFGFVATCQAIHYSGNKVRFCDIDNSLLLDPDKVRSIIEENPDKIGAIVPVHMYGLECHLKEFDAIGKEYNIPVIFDSAHCIGNPNMYDYGDAHCLSFSPTKLITTFEGGAVFSKHSALLNHLE